MNKRFKQIILIAFFLSVTASCLQASAEFFDLPESDYTGYMFVWGRTEYGRIMDRDLQNSLRKARTVLRFTWRDRYWFNRIRYLIHVLVIPKKRYKDYSIWGFKPLQGVTFTMNMSRRSNMGRGIGHGQIYKTHQRILSYTVSELPEAFRDTASGLIDNPFETYGKMYPDDIADLRIRPEKILKWQELGYGFQYSFEITTTDDDSDQPVRLFKTSRLKEEVRY